MLGQKNAEAASLVEADEPSPKSMNIVDVLSANKIYADGTEALAPVTLSIAPGEFLTLIGPSGCGKSTLLKLVANLIEPTDGRLQWWRGGFDSRPYEAKGADFSPPSQKSRRWRPFAPARRRVPGP